MDKLHEAIEWAEAMINKQWSVIQSNPDYLKALLIAARSAETNEASTQLPEDFDDWVRRRDVVIAAFERVSFSQYEWNTYMRPLLQLVRDRRSAEARAEAAEHAMEMLDKTSFDAAASYIRGVRDAEAKREEMGRYFRHEIYKWIPGSEAQRALKAAYQHFAGGSLLTEREVCEWKQRRSEISGDWIFVTGCGHRLERRVVDAFEFCPFRGCGLPIEIKE